MATGDEYRVRAADMQARARDEHNPEIRADFESLAMAYLRLADQADRRVLYEANPRQTHPAHPTQQQQQPQQQQQQPQTKPEPGATTREPQAG